MRRDDRRPMDPIRLRVDMRGRALDRLSRLTTGAAVAGTLATVGFGGLAAVTYSGTSSDQQAVDDSTSQSQAQDNNQPGTGATPQSNGTNQSTGSAPSATQPPTQQVVPAQPPSVSTHHRVHVSSGGSG